LNVTALVTCVPGVPLAGRPFRFVPGAAGRVTTRLRFVVDVCLFASVTVTVMGKVPVEAGVPLSVPLEDIVTPPGSPVAVHVYGGVPPVAEKPTEKDVPITGGVMPVVVIVTGAGLTVRLRLAVAVTPVLSVTVTLTVKTPSAVGVPVLAPDDETLSPVGNPVAVHV
jgi:hypothetical protein